MSDLEVSSNTVIKVDVQEKVPLLKAIPLSLQH